MKLFSIEPDAVGKPAISDDEDVGPVRSTGRSEGLREWVAAKFHTVDATIDVTELARRLNVAIEEVSGLIAAQSGKIYDGITIDEVSVELGITTGGEIGLFAKGRLDVAASFSVTFKIQPSGTTTAKPEAAK